MRPISILFALVLIIGCGPATESVRPDASQSATATASPRTQGSTRGAAALQQEARIVILGDSLTAGLGVAAEQAYPALLEETLRERGWPVRVINAGVSGDTSAGGRSRLGWLLGQRPLLVVVALGANDGLRGLPVDALADNLRAIVRASREAGARVLLLGMKVPPNYGEDYADRFEAVYPGLAETLEVPLMPFMLESVGGRESLNQADGIHPNPAGHRAIAADVMPHLERVLREAMAERGEDEPRRDAK